MKKKILIVENLQTHLDLCTQILDEQYQVITARSGKEGIDKALKFNPDLILMDLELPEVDGWEAARKIKQSVCTIPIVAVTAHSLEADEQRARNAGCDDYLAKPFLPEQLKKIVKENIREEETKATPSKHQKAAQRKYKILVVDQDRKNAELMKQQIELEGYDVVIYSRGKQVLDIASEANPDIVLLNVVVSELHGLQICKLLKDHFRDKYLPIIFVSSKEELMSRTLDIHKSRGIGPDDYLEKPYGIEELKLCIESQLKKIKLYENYQLLSKYCEETSEIFKDTQKLLDEVCFKKAK